MHGVRPIVVGTAARNIEGAAGYAEIKGLIEDHGPCLLAFGTGWGLTDGFLAGCDRVLKPINGLGEYNHLPVRAAVAIILDRLAGIVA